MRPSLLVVLALAAVVLTPSAARACSCLPPRPPLESLGDAAAVFEGRMTGFEIEGSTMRVHFTVVRVWKGDVTGEVEVRTATSSAACGRRYDSGISYVVYAHELGDELGDNLCSRTRRSADAAEDLATLGPWHPPRPAHAPDPIADASTAPESEPPRIEPSGPPPVSPAPPGRHGCGVAGEMPHTPALLGIFGLVLLATRRPRILPCPTKRSPSARRPGGPRCRSVTFASPSRRTNRSAPTRRARPSERRSRPS